MGQDSIAEMSEQIDQLGKLKARIEKDKMTVRMQLDDTRSASEHVTHEKAVVEKNIKAQEVQLQALHKKIEENLGNASMFQKVNIQSQSQLDDAKRLADDE